MEADLRRGEIGSGDLVVVPKSRGARGREGQAEGSEGAALSRSAASLQSATQREQAIGYTWSSLKRALHSVCSRFSSEGFELRSARSFARSVGRECARALTRAHPNSRQRDTQCEESCRDRRAYTAIERGDSYEGGRAIELNRGRFSRGKRHGGCSSESLSSSHPHHHRSHRNR